MSSSFCWHSVLTPIAQWFSCASPEFPPLLIVSRQIIQCNVILLNRKFRWEKDISVSFWNARAINWYSNEKTEFDEEFIHIDGAEWRIFLPPGSLRIFEFSDIFLIDSQQYSSCLLIRKSNLFLMRSNIILSWKMKNK